jgi:hypothetical protein
MQYRPAQFDNPDLKGIFPRNSPVRALAGGVILILAGMIVALFVLASRSAVARSSYTQANGVRDRATVSEARNQGCEHKRAQDPCAPSATVWVRLDEPVAGTTDSVVSVPHTVPFSAGQSIPVLVDPKDPGYAELPGQPSAPSGGNSTQIGEAAAVILLVLGCGGIVQRAWSRWRKGVWTPMWPLR